MPRIQVKRPDRALIRTVRRELQARCEPGRAEPMQAYMKSAMPFYGVGSTQMRTACKVAFAKHPLPDFEAWRDTVLTLWREARYREEWYAAIELTGLRSHRRHQTMRALPMYEEMIVTGAWWDVVDAIATTRFKVLFDDFAPTMTPRMRTWAHSRDLWKRRSAILSQLKRKEETDLDLLTEAIEQSMDSKEFFLRKAIGWALRQYARTDPNWVILFVQQREKHLSGLSRREALKHIA